MPNTVKWLRRIREAELCASMPDNETRNLFVSSVVECALCDVVVYEKRRRELHSFGASGASATGSI